MKLMFGLAGILIAFAVFIEARLYKIAHSQPRPLVNLETPKPDFKDISKVDICSGRKISTVEDRIKGRSICH